MPDMREDEVEGVVAQEPDEGNAKTPELSFDELMAEPEPDAVDAALARDLAARATDEAVVAEAEETGPVACEFVCGRAGSGKSFWCKAQIAADPAWGLLCATTGISAINLDAVTINSTLKYFDTDSLRENYLQGSLTRAIHDLALQYRRLVIDEVSMMSADQLDLIHRATAEANGYRDIIHPMGITLVGDFAQLPSIKARWAFEAACWPEFAAHTTRLTKMWRQDQAEFLDALQAARMGDGARAASILQSVGVQWHTSLDTAFDGTTIIPKNDAVDRFNWIALERVKGAPVAVSSRRWGKLRAEWKNIPERLQLKVGCYVMILSNQLPDFDYVNGDCGHLEGFDAGEMQVRLVRNGNVVSVPRLVRSVATKDKPSGFYGSREEGYCARPHRDAKGRYVEGQVEYYPLRLAYGSTVHKSQGLSLDRCQIDFRNSFFRQYGMLYVALSRVRTLEGLRLVGERERFMSSCNADPKVGPWL